DPKKYENVARYMGTDQKTLQLMENFNTTIGLQKIKSPAAQAALEGQKGMMVTRNYRGAEVLSSYAPLKLNGLNWAILAEIEVANKLRQTEEQLAIKKQENNILLQNILPSAIAERRKQGELLIADSFKQITILNAHVAGIADLNKRMSPTEVTQLLTQLFNEF